MVDEGDFLQLLQDDKTLVDQFTLLAGRLDQVATQLPWNYAGQIAGKIHELRSFLDVTPAATHTALPAYRRWYQFGATAQAARPIQSQWIVKTFAEPTEEGGKAVTARILNPHPGVIPWFYGARGGAIQEPKYPNPELPFVQWHGRGRSRNKLINRFLPAGRIPWRMALTTQYGYQNRPGGDATHGTLGFAQRYRTRGNPPATRVQEQLRDIIQRIQGNEVATALRVSWLRALGVEGAQ